MSWYPAATRDPISRVGSYIKPVGVVLHTAVSNSEKLKPWGTVTWHFYVNKYGKAYQFVDTQRVAYCQMDGNYFGGKGFISIETWDGAGSVWNGRNVATIPPWNDAQVEALAKIIAWAAKEHDFDVERATAALGHGVGYHRQYTSYNYPRWNQSHACPGDTRIAQVPGIIARAKALLEDKPEPEPKEWDELASKEEIQDAVREVVAAEIDKAFDLTDPITHSGLKETRQGRNWLVTTAEDVRDVKSGLIALRTELVALRKAVAAK